MNNHDLFDFTEHEWDPDWKGKTLAVSLHTHSDQSLDGGSTVEQMVDRAISLGYSHFTLSEHGNLNSAAPLWKYIEKLQQSGKSTIHPFHSVEGYIKFPEDDKDTHITIGFLNREVYSQYSKLTKKLYSKEQGVSKFGDIKPVMTVPQFEELAQYGVVIGTGCVGSWLNRLIMKGKFQEARKRMEWMISIVGKENIFDEWIVDDLSKHFVKPQYGPQKEIIAPARIEENECNPHLGCADVGKGCNYARREYVTGVFNITPVASLDAHYARKSDKIVQDAKTAGSDWVMTNFQHLKGAAEYASEAKKNQDLSDKFIEELIDNTHAYAERFSDYSFRTAKKDGWLIPEYTENRKWVWDVIEKVGRIDTSKQEYVERLEYEISVFADNGVADFLNYVRQVREIVDLAEKHGILCNVRGSAGGSLLYFGLGISVTDPLKYDLPFERHLTPGRIKAGTLPDADLDFSDKQKMFSLLREQYGDRFVPISIDTKLKPKSAIKDAERSILGHVRKETEILTKTMPTVPQGADEQEWLLGVTDSEGVHTPGYFDSSPALQEYAKANPKIWELVVHMCGVQRQKSSHACGAVLLSEPVQNIIPLYKVSGINGDFTTAFSPSALEYVGGVKIDLLGVSTMYTIQKAMELIKKRHGIELKWGEFEQDPNVYEQIYLTGDTEGTFQTSTSGIRQLALKTYPKNIEDISNIIALYRPSCLDAKPSWDESFSGNLVDYYVAARKEAIKPRYIHEELDSIYGNTQSCPVYQEQILKTFRDLGGMSYEEAELARRAISKKDAKALATEGGKLVNKCLERGWSEKQANELFDMVMASARYGFNKSHSVSYAIVSYDTAYLKYHYPLEFWAAELSCHFDREDKLRAYAELLGDQILPPDVLKSDANEFTIDGEKLRAPLCLLKGVGEKAVDSLQRLVHHEFSELGLQRK